MVAFLGFLVVLLLAFIGVQWNDPDGWLWALIYSVPLVALLVAIFQKNWYSNSVFRAVSLLCVVASLALVVFYWPPQKLFWQQDVWWEEETAREGMGMMIAALCLIAGVWGGFKRGGRSHADD